MSVTIPQSFQTFKENLEITGLQKTVVSTRQTHVREVVEAGMKVVDAFLTGSYSRSTMIAPLKEADIDILVVLDSSYFHKYQGQNGGPAALLDAVKSTLRKTYTRTPDISRNGQAVTIRFDDFVVDVVPGFNRQGGGYLIPNSVSQTWISTDPKRHVEIVSAANASHSGNFVPLVKMIKAWNREVGGPFRSFHLEVLALLALQGVEISDYPSGIRFFFDKARSLVAVQNADPAGYGGDVGSYISLEKVPAAVATFQLAYETAIRAESFEKSGYTKSAIQMWTQLFGNYFPAYG